MPIHSHPAKTTAIPVNALKSLGYTAALWAVFLLTFPALIVWLESHTGLSATRFEPGSLRRVAVLVFVGGALIGFWSGFTLVRLGEGTPMPLECTHALVIAGPYRYIRNPMSAMGIAQGLAVGCYLGSTLTLIYAVVGAFVWNYLLRPWEEKDLSVRFGEPYDRYRRSVPCWLPRLTPYHHEPSIEPPSSQ